MGSHAKYKMQYFAKIYEYNIGINNYKINIMENKSLEESIIAAMDGQNIDLIKYLPYILQDFLEIVTSPEEIIKIIRKYKTNYSSLNVFDLGSGKGTAFIKIASELGRKCFGIDAIDDFVVFSNNKSNEGFLK
jgi:hypothetical protein